MDLVAGDIMTYPIISAREEMAVGELISLLQEKRISGVPVVDADDRLVGVISITDLLALSTDIGDTSEFGGPDFHTSPAMDGLSEAHGLLEPEDEVLALPVRDLMSRNAITASEQTPIGELADTMLSHRIHRLVVVRDRKAVGIVSIGDILRTLRDRFQAGD